MTTLCPPLYSKMFDTSLENFEVYKDFFILPKMIIAVDSYSQTYFL